MQQNPAPDGRRYPTEDVEDVTEALGETDPHARLYRLPSGRVMRVTGHEAKHPTLLEHQRLVLMSCTPCGSDGRPLEAAPTKLHKHLSQLHPAAPHHPEQVETGRRILALQHELLIYHQEEPLPGVGAATDEHLVLHGMVTPAPDPDA
jgi:hypothetical protein